MYKLSVIVPIYNVEKYIEQCAISLFEQTLEDIEYIFIDDCTPDNSIKILNNILKLFPSKIPHVKICRHNKNMGLVKSRITGINIASGQYLAHCDSDDYVEKEMYFHMYSSAINNDSDIVICDYYKTDGNFHLTVDQRPNSNILKGPVWNKIVHSRIYKNKISYPLATKAEDGVLMTQLSYYSKTITYVNLPLYYYRYNPASICNTPSTDACLDRFYQECKNTELIINFYNTIATDINSKSLILEWKNDARNNLLPLIDNRKFYKMWINQYKEINITYIFHSKTTIKNKIVFLLNFTKLGRWIIKSYQSLKIN